MGLMVREQPQHRYRERGIRAGEVSVRLALPHKRGRRDELVDRRHNLGFKRFAGRGLRCIVERDGLWLCLSGWQTGALKLICAHLSDDWRCAKAHFAQATAARCDAHPETRRRSAARVSTALRNERMHCRRAGEPVRRV